MNLFSNLCLSSFYFSLHFFFELGGEKRAIQFMKREGRAGSKMPLLDHGSEKGIVKHHFPMNYIFKPWKLGQWVYQVIKFGIVQYVSVLLPDLEPIFLWTDKIYSSVVLNTYNTNSADDNQSIYCYFSSDS